MHNELQYEVDRAFEAMNTQCDGATPARGFVLNRLEPLFARVQDEGLDLLESLALAYLLGVADGGVKLTALLRHLPHLR